MQAIEQNDLFTEISAAEAAQMNGGHRHHYWHRWHHWYPYHRPCYYGYSYYGRSYRYW